MPWLAAPSQRTSCRQGTCMPARQPAPRDSGLLLRWTLHSYPYLRFKTSLTFSCLRQGSKHTDNTSSFAGAMIQRFLRQSMVS